MLIFIFTNTLSASAQEIEKTAADSELTASLSGIQFRIFAGPEFSNAFKSHIDFNGNDDETYTTSFDGLNTGFEFGYSWGTWGLFVHTEFSSHWKRKNTDNELNTKEHWNSVEIDAFFRAFWNPTMNMHPFLGIGVGVFLSDNILNDRTSNWDKHSLVVAAEGGIEWNLMPQLTLGFRVNAELSGIFSGTIGIRPSIIIGYTL